VFFIVNVSIFDYVLILSHGNITSSDVVCIKCCCRSNKTRASSHHCAVGDNVPGDGTDDS